MLPTVPGSHWSSPAGPTSPPRAGTFQQRISHADATLGNFSQRYWYNTEFYKGPGSPVILFTPGEVEADGYQAYLTNRTLLGNYAQTVGAAVILLEHRYWGESSPYKVLDTKALQHLTIENAVHDLNHFARNVKLPFDTTGATNAPKAPWVNVGGSYSGALAAWQAKLAPGTFWAYHASSAPVQAVYDFWSYFLPIQNGMPRNCSADFARIAERIDEVIQRGNATEIKALQKLFGAEQLEHADDFSGMFGNVLGEWQSVQFFSGYSDFFQMCDSVEGVRAVRNGKVGVPVDSYGNGTGVPVPADGIGVDKALANFAKWFKYESLPNTCANLSYSEWSKPESVGCFDTYNLSCPFYTDMSVNNTVGRQWFWLLCNEPLFYWQTGAPKNKTTILSRYVSAEWYQRQCGLMFPKQGNLTFGSGTGRTADDVNKWTDGWLETNTTRLLWVNGEFDPWRSASVSSELRPGGPLTSTAQAPIFLIPGGRHCNDLAVKNGDSNPEVKKIQAALQAQMKTWVSEFYSKNVAKVPRGADLGGEACES
ncbi:serine carboxypeptidase S28 [Thozetella sp. PMI_491]|nr:serine carboxypeptidase S28 [Thozetella sp. PMI_491]